MIPVNHIAEGNGCATAPEPAPPAKGTRRAGRMEKRRAQLQEAPIANGDDGAADGVPPIANGDSGTPPPTPPIANGDNGELPPDSAPSANGDNGAPAPDGPPSPNGGNGAGAAGAPPQPLPPGLLHLVEAMLGRAFRARPADGTTP